MMNNFKWYHLFFMLLMWPLHWIKKHPLFVLTACVVAVTATWLLT